MDLYIFTVSYPYLQAAEQTFIREELLLLSRKFSKIIIVPKYTGGEKDELDINNVSVDYTFTRIVKKRKLSRLKFLLRFKFLWLVLKELFFNRRELFSILNIKQLLNYLLDFTYVYEWEKNIININNALLYTYWYTSFTAGLTFSNKKYKIITRVHGIDLFENRNNGYIPFRKQSIYRINKIYCASNYALSYLKERYKGANYELARLGTVKPPKIVKRKPSAKMLKVVSCSGIISIKRVELIVCGLIDFVEQFPSYEVVYTHFGDGNERQRIEDLLKNTRNNLNYNFPGAVLNSKILDYYANESVDVFIHMSSTEGGCPLAIQEAQSYGIPVIAAANGGVIEMIKDGYNGFLLKPAPSIDEIVNALTRYCKLSNDDKLKFSRNSFNNWNKYFNGKKNQKEFVETIINL